MEANHFHWARKVSRRDIRRLYDSEAEDCLDEALLDEVMYTIHIRVKDMFEVRLAQQTGRVTCRSCGEAVSQPLRMGSINRREPLVCPNCGWQTTCGEYLASYTGKDLLPGSREDLFVEFQQRFKSACTPREKMLLLDWLIHAFHSHSGVSGRLVAMNIIQGSRDELVDLINGLAGSEVTRAAKEKWQAENDNPIRRFRLRYPSRAKVLEVAASLGIRGRTSMPENELIAEILHLAPEMDQDGG